MQFKADFKRKKKEKLTDREITTATYVLRALQLGLTLGDLDNLEQGFVMDMIIESANDNCEYDAVASQDDFNSF